MNQIQVPPTITDPAVRRAAGAYTKLLEENARVARELEALERRRPEAVEEDRAAYAGAIRRGKPDPGTTRLDELDAEIASTRRRSEALAKAVGEAQSELVGVVESRRGEWAAEIDARVAADRKTLAEAVEAVASARERLSESLSMSGWLQRFPAKSAWLPPAALAGVDGLPSRNGDPIPWGDVIAALRSYGSAPANV